MTEIRLSSKATKFIKKLKDKNLKNKIKQSIELIAKDYTVGDLKTGDLRGIYSLDVFYNKTNYEIAYTVDEDENIFILVLLIGTRENFYKELKEYIWENGFIIILFLIL